MSLEDGVSNLVWRVWPRPKPHCEAGSFGDEVVPLLAGMLRVTDRPCKWQTTRPRNSQPGNQLMYVFSSLKPQTYGRVSQGHMPLSRVCWMLVRALCLWPRPSLHPGTQRASPPWCSLGRWRVRESLGALEPTQLACRPRPCLVPVPCAWVFDVPCLSYKLNLFFCKQQFAQWSKQHPGDCRWALGCGVGKRPRVQEDRRFWSRSGDLGWAPGSALDSEGSWSFFRPSLIMKGVLGHSSVAIWILTIWKLPYP